MKNLKDLKPDKLEREMQDTPYFLFDLAKIRKNINNYKTRDFFLNYSVKSCLFENLVKETEYLLDGFTVSSKGDLQKVRNETQKPIHFVSPLIRDVEIKEINSIGSSIAFNTIEQFQRFKKQLSSRIKSFIRINPEKSFLTDDRYNPCKPNSQLGVPVSLFADHLKTQDLKLDGLHFHNNCQSDKPEQIVETMNHIESCLGNHLEQLQYINMGGGYLYSEKLITLLNQLKKEWNQKYGVVLKIEPGFDISNSAGFLKSSVIDIFNRQGKDIVVLDTTVNHLPEVFEYEYQIKPAILNQAEKGHEYIVCGCSCLAGDVFGEYCFDKALKVGDFITFKDVGSYSYVKIHKFNGIEKPGLTIEKSIVSKSDKKIAN